MYLEILSSSTRRASFLALYHHSSHQSPLKISLSFIQYKNQSNKIILLSISPLVSLELNPKHSRLLLLPRFLPLCLLCSLASEPRAPQADWFSTCFTNPIFLPVPLRHNRCHCTATQGVLPGKHETNRNRRWTLTSPLVHWSFLHLSLLFQDRENMLPAWFSQAPRGAPLSTQLFKKVPKLAFRPIYIKKAQSSTDGGLSEMCSVQHKAVPAFPGGRTFTKICKAQGSSTSPHPPVQPLCTWVPTHLLPWAFRILGI